MDYSQVDTPWLAFIAGLITSPHCLLMCTPIALVLLAPPANTSPQKRLVSHGLYHAARITSFGLFGALAGALGLSLVNILRFPFFKYLPIALVALLLLFAFKLERFIPKIPWIQRQFANASQKLKNFPKPYGALLLGLITPLLPCAPLYMILWICLISADPLIGGSIAVAFGIGTLPLTYATSMILPKFKLSPIKVHGLQRIVAFLMAAFIVYRLWQLETPLDPKLVCC